jgi:hypothetical protein
MKHLLTVGLGLTLFLISAASHAQYSQKTEEALAKEPPLTQHDIDTYIKFAA